MALGKNPMQRNKNESLWYITQKSQFKQIKELNIRPKSIKLQKKVGSKWVNFLTLVLALFFYNKFDTKNKINKNKTKQLGLHQNKKVSL